MPSGEPLIVPMHSVAGPDMQTGKRPAAIEVHGLSRRFGQRWALTGVDLAIARGELFGIVGADGAGKTTLLQSICAILDPTQGRVRVNGLDSVQESARITATLGYMSQAYSLYGDLTVAENLRFFAEVRGVPSAVFAGRKEKLLRFSGLAPFLDRRTRDLSGGMQKKLALCCSLVHEPPILILDEPTLGVDPLSRRELWAMLHEFHAGGKTIVMATSYMEEAAQCERLALLSEGRILACDRPPAFGPDLEEAVKALLGKDAHAAVEAVPAQVQGNGAAIRVEGLTRRFGSFTAVDKVSFTIGRGEVFGLLGPNGSGKSTTIKMLCGILPPSAGSVEIAGVDMAMAPALAKGRIGYMSQRFSLYLDLTVEENVEFYGAVYGLTHTVLQTQKDWVLRLAGLKGFERTLASSLSGAFRQRLALGCAVLHRPNVLFLDEPTSGVDPLSREKFWTLIAGIAASGTAVLVTTHYLHEAEGCHRVAFINRGRILCIDPPAQLHAKFGGASLEEVFLQLMEHDA